LRGSQITLLTRLLTVCDIYAALVEARSYKTALNPEEAILILVRMALQGKVDYDIVRKLSQVFDMTLPDSLLEVQQNLIEGV
jgi:HD-GYP domain-containing protein (c-di-GMP phosphodiesterase class II)